MRPILVLLVVLVAIGALLFGVYTLLGDSSSGDPEIGPAPVEVVQQREAGTDTLTGAVREPRQAGDVAPVPTERDERGAIGDFKNELRGAVHSPDGVPLANAQVTLTTHGTNEITFQNDPVDRSKERVTRTNDQGIYAFRNLAPRDRYKLVAEHPDYARTEMMTNSIDEQGLFEEPPLTMEFGARLTGYVEDTAGNRIPDATLTLDGMFTLEDGETAADRETIQTNPEGFYAFENVSRGNQMRTLSVTAPGYASQQRQGLLFRPNKDEITVDFTLQPALMLSGRVVGPGNQGIAGARVIAIGTQHTQKGARSRTVADENGQFLFEDLAPGKYMVQPRKKGWRYIEIPRAEAGEANVILEMVPEAMITGRVVTAASSEPVTNFTARLRFHYNDDVPSAPSDIKGTFENPDGEFTLEGVKAGKYVVEARATGFAPSFSMPFSITQSRNMAGIEVRMTEGGTVTGTIVDTKGEPLADVRVRTEDNEWMDDVFQRALGESFPSNATTRETRTDSAGRFEMKGLHEASYQVIANAPGYTSVAKMEVVVTEGVVVDVGRLKLSRGGTLRGTLYDGAGQPVVAGQVMLEPTSLSGAGPFRRYQTKSGQDGKFTVANVTPGIYRVMATRSATNTGSPFAGLLDAKNSERQVTITGDEVVTQDLTLNE